MGNICHQWDYQLSYFTQFQEFSVCIFDNRGSGLSSVPEGRYKTCEMAMDVVDLLDHLGWQKFHLVGLSMGGMIAQELAYAHPKRLLSLTLESTTAYFNGLPTVAYKAMIIGGPPANTLDSFVEHVVDNLLFPKQWLEEFPSNSKEGTNRDRIINFFKERYGATGLQTPKSRSSQKSACLTHNLQPHRLTQIKRAHIPTLVLTGDSDNVLIQPSSSAYLAKMLGGKLIVLKGGGHAVRLQFPEIHNDLLHKHILDAEHKHEARNRDSMRLRPLHSFAEVDVHVRNGHIVEEHSILPHVSVEIEKIEKLERVSWEGRTSSIGILSREPSWQTLRSSIASSTTSDIEDEKKLEGDGRVQPPLVARFLPSLGMLRFGFRDVVGMIPGNPSA
ncbi:hypothetical protein HDV05_000644 [Chytridiales sp. JEL 0842]|nr:hypothetical protein HDV05_000644 [Chytridiales sp. JEL 0842]